MLARLMRDGGTLYFLLAIYFAVNAALRIALQGSLELEEGRLFFLAQWLAPGYGGQAPLPIWMQHGATRLLGAEVPAVIVLQNLLLFLTYAFVGRAAFRVIRNRALAIIAVLGMTLLPQVVFEMQRDGGASVAALMTAAFFLTTLFAMLERGSFIGYLLAGLGVGLGILANYDFILLLASALVVILLEPTFRARLANWRIILTIVVAGVVLAPHALWLRDNSDVVIAESLARIPHHVTADQSSQTIQGLFSLAATLAGFAVPTIIVFWFAFGRRFAESWRASTPWTRLVGGVFLLILLALVALIVFGNAAAIHDRWLVPFFFMLPLYLGLKLDALNQIIGNAPKRFAIVAILILVTVPIVLAARVPAAPWTRHYTKVNRPYRPAIEAMLATGRNPPCLILAEDAELAGNLRLGAGNIPVVAADQPSLKKGYRFDESHPLLLVWRAGADGQAQIPERLARLHTFQVEAGASILAPETVGLPYRFGREGDVYRISYAWVYPAAP